jgi:hypothetical protein
MTVFQNKQRGRVWTYEFWHDRRRYRGRCLDRTTGQPVKTKTAALAVETARKAEVQGRPRNAGRSDVRSGRYTIAMAGAAHIRRLVDRKRNPAHIENNRLYVAEIMTQLGASTAFGDLTQHDADVYAKFAYGQTLKTWLGGRRKKTDEDLVDPALWRDTGRPRSIRTANNYLKCFKKLLGMAAKVRDPVTKQPAFDLAAIEIDLERPPRRKPRPMADQEIAARMKTLTPWAREATALSRLFGLRLDEALRAEERHVDAHRKCLFFRGEETKSGADEEAHGGDPGWRLLQMLRKQARRRKTTFLITWPGPAWVHVVAAGKTPKPDAWLPLKSLGTSWRKSGRRAGVASSRFHDIRGRFVTEVAKTSKVSAQGAARHLSAATTELYIGIADDEIKQAVAEANQSKAGRAVLELVGGRPLGTSLGIRGSKPAKSSPTVRSRSAA